MFLGTLTFDLYIPESDSLKGKRFIIKSLKDRLRKRFNVSVAENANDLWQRTTLWVVCVSNDGRHLYSTMQNVRDMIEKEPLIEILNCTVEVS
ncbi:MAG: DUF503 domain-containing protein [Nitrospirae bacterium]|uniref:DUF503 domain-containing protein n=1 Tax=Candidatus Magnetobacterium casense TaxID=1455061 RepID=UPI00058B301A|nr:DUF503 domain-containing protein [Candidatus Magnetobacterium casensis]MBF0337829.1 DUF503 domain-containing protein [Nitrospirota bacterium]